MRLPAAFLILACTAPMAFAGNAPTIEMAQLITGTPQQKLQKLLRPHAYFGGVVTPDIRAATGQPDIPVIDRRHVWGEIYSCNYQFLNGPGEGRALVCD